MPGARTTDALPKAAVPPNPAPATRCTARAVESHFGHGIPRSSGTYKGSEIDSPQPVQVKPSTNSPFHHSAQSVWQRVRFSRLDRV